MRRNQDIVEKLRLSIERRFALKARFKERVFVRQLNGTKVSWKGDVYVFGLNYDTKAAAINKEVIANWKLPGPTASSLEAAEKRGRVLRKLMETHKDGSTVIKRQPKLAYAWQSPAKGGKGRIHVVLHEGTIRSPVDAVRVEMRLK